MEHQLIANGGEVYRLGLVGSTKLVVSAHISALIGLAALDSPRHKTILAAVAEEYGLEPFRPYEGGGWGFGNCMRPLENDDTAWRSWICDLPILLERTTNGMAEEKYSRGHALLLSLKYFFKCMTHMRPAQDFPYQLICYQLDATIREGNTMPLLGATVSPQLGQRLREMSSHCFEQVSETMAAAYAHMTGYKPGVCPLEKRSFRATVIDGQLGLFCPGSACNFIPCPEEKRHASRGYNMVGTNLDAFPQVFTVLAGLAATENLVRYSS
jgi:hypothetical protein